MLVVCQCNGSGGGGHVIDASGEVVATSEVAIIVDVGGASMLVVGVVATSLTLVVGWSPCQSQCW